MEELNESGVYVRVRVNWKYPVFHSLRSPDRKQNRTYRLLFVLTGSQQNSVKRAVSVLCVYVLGGEGKGMLASSALVVAVSVEDSVSVSYTHLTLPTNHRV